ncbi:hypothetical protein ACLOJK_027133 [Asimina triloba]
MNDSSQETVTGSESTFRILRTTLWLDEANSSSQIHVHSTSEVLTGKQGQMGAKSNLNTDKHDEIVGDIGDLLQCVSTMNQEIHHLKREVLLLKEVDRRREFDASVIKRNQVLMGVITIHPKWKHKGTAISFVVDFGRH